MLTIQAPNEDAMGCRACLIIAEGAGHCDGACFAGFDLKTRSSWIVQAKMRHANTFELVVF
jgi:hypothetical protein